jgi:hypothetical protein
MKLRDLLPLLSLPLLAATAGDAMAQSEPGPAPPPASFMLMGPDGTASSATAAITVLTAEGDSDNIVRFDLSGQFVAPSGMGGYASIAGSSLDGDSHLGSLELGGLWHRPGAEVDTTFRVGLILPTSGQGDDFGDGALGHLISTFYARPSDLLTAAPSTTTLRAAVTPMLRRDRFVARADVGLDIVLDTDGDNPDAPYLHVDLGAGYDDGRMAFMFELATMSYLDDTDELLHVAAITGQLHAGVATPYLSLSKPLGDAVPDIDILGITVGVRGRL